MTTEDTLTARQALAQELHQTGALYAQKAQTLSSIATQLESLPDGESEGFPFGATHARDKANYAALCANFLAASAHRIQNGDYDWEFLQMVREFIDPMVVPDDMAAPSAS